MCGRAVFVSRSVLLQIADELSLGFTESIKCNDVSYTQSRPGMDVAYLERGADDKLHVASGTWGVQAPWAKRLLYNARIESQDSQVWAEAFATSRIILAAHCFYEPSGHGAYEFSSANDSILLLAGIAQQGRAIVVTCPPNDVVAPIHSRMPLLLDAPNARTWLSAGESWRTILASTTPLTARPEPATPGQTSLF